MFQKRWNKKNISILDKKQIKDNKKLKFCDHVVVNENLYQF